MLDWCNRIHDTSQCFLFPFFLPSSSLSHTHSLWYGMGWGKNDFHCQLKIWRNFDRNTNTMHPGMVDAKAVRQKLSKQLNIDLEEESEDSQEKVHLQATPLDEFEDWTEQELEKALDAIPTDKPCQTQVREMGLFLAKISLAGGYSVPLKVRVLRR